MMIRINLLPTRQVKKRNQGTQTLVLLVATLVVALVGNFVWFYDRQSTSDALAVKITGLQRQIEEKKRIIKEVETIRARRLEVQKRLDVLKALRDGRSGPVRMLDALASATPKNVWITAFDQAAKGVKVTGRAGTNDDLAEFMRGLGNAVWTPKGLGRLVDQRAGGKTSRVELLALEGGAIEEFPVTDIKPFFSNIDLKKSEAKDEKSASLPERVVEFELAMTADYAT